MEKQESFLKTITEIAFCIFVAYTCVCMCLWVCMCRPEGVFSLSFPPCFLKQALSLSPELTNCLDGMARGLPGSWCLHVPVLGSQHMLPSWLFMSAGDQNSDPYTWTATILFAEPSRAQTTAAVAASKFCSWNQLVCFYLVCTFSSFNPMLRIRNPGGWASSLHLTSS